MIHINRLTCCGLLLWAAAAAAQQAPAQPYWVEETAPTPPTYSKDALIPIDMPSYVSLQVGIDPVTLSVGKDGVVRYVVVMRNAAGSTTAAFEGIRCTTDEVKTYARVNAADHWVILENPEWKPINGNMPSKHAFAIARQGACDTHLSSSREATLKALKHRQKAGSQPAIYQ